MDADVERLVREERLREAAELASSRGDARTACDLFERACDFRAAAAAASNAGLWTRALALALEGKDAELAEKAFENVARDPKQAERLAFVLERRGDHLWAGRLFEAIGSRSMAARAFERAGEAVRAARILETDGDVVAAARVLEGLARKSPERLEAHVALGALLLRYGKTDAAIRSLQKIPEGAEERRQALSLLVEALDRAGLPDARAAAERELTELGGPLPSAEPERHGDVRARLFGRYDIVREVASSPSARVLEALDGVRGERVAVKIFAGYDARGAGRDALARFEREVRVLGTLDHPNIVPLRDYLAEGPAIVMAWMAKGTLEQMIAREPLAPARSIEIAQAVLLALGEAHRLGVIHRDIKPANVLFDDAGVTRLGDFGVAHLNDLSATATAGVIGTLGYMSPEQREGRPAGVRTDLYGVGAVLWEMLTGERPEAGLDGRTLRVRPSALHRDLDARHDALVLSFMSTDPKDRPDDAFAARRALGSLVWPMTIERAAALPAAPRMQSERPSAGRLSMTEGEVRTDTWLGRPIVALPFDPTTLARARAFAKADHPALQTVLRVDRTTREIWLSDVRGSKISGRLSAAQSANLRAAIDRLHDLGEPHGSIDADHIRIDAQGAVILMFEPSRSPTATVDLDRLALAHLS